MTETMTLLFWLTYEHMNQGAIYVCWCSNINMACCYFEKAIKCRRFGNINTRPPDKLQPTQCKTTMVLYAECFHNGKAHSFAISAISLEDVSVLLFVKVPNTLNICTKFPGNPSDHWWSPKHWTNNANHIDNLLVCLKTNHVN